MAEAVAAVWRRLSFEQRAAAVGSVLLVVSTFGPFSWVEAAIVLTGLSVLFGLRQRAVGKSFHLPAADGTLIAAAGGWAAGAGVTVAPPLPLAGPAVSVETAIPVSCAVRRARTSFVRIPSSSWVSVSRKRDASQRMM